MRNKKLRLAALMALLMNASVFADSGQLFVRPVAAYVHPTNDQFNTTAAVGLDVGTIRGSRQQNEFSLDSLFMSMGGTSTSGPDITSGKLKSMSLLGGYRYHFGEANAKVRFYLGASAGVDYLQASARIGSPPDPSVPYINLARSEKAWKPAVSGCAGLKVKMAERVDFDIGFRYLWVSSAKDISVGGYTADLHNSKAYLVYAGLDIKL
jgi:opacity protein-like surface antigen